ncbi:MAG: hypothetical protein IM537_16360 [Pseudanabaena sp. M57BS1SP1A06MG]|uniref:hypothetical protein n=1 Tax=Pseudanabaena mucicola TaxID=71190 RepID=UPI0025768D85|nr:hypothetical protein [Pseudanabaena mucicola]MCA6581439.1 hypothetical protein [Pseudanabaena sp. M34BS1SP1A06MG]MCA6591262.1 hypothetical protein [Pseudanabaena sp. M38BS1SP1A06MG]MCA6601726.1 hypothetical protein [Pseudanabaena sp. M57BS1SP1A06MG]
MPIPKPKPDLLNLKSNSDHLSSRTKPDLLNLHIKQHRPTTPTTPDRPFPRQTAIAPHHP